MRWPVVLTLLWCVVVGGTRSADAQYFGKNKVQYQKFNFKVLATEHFDIYYYPEEETAVQLAARMAERWYARLAKLLQHELSSRQPLILYAAHPHFQQTNVLAGEIGEGTGGVTESAKRRIILPFAGGLAETDHVLGHELVHAFQYDIAAGSGDRGRSGMASLPLWFVEGMAEYLSIGPVDANTAMWIRDASAREKMPSVDKLDDPNFFPYRYGHAFWAYIGGRWGDQAVANMLHAAASSGDVTGAIESVLGIDKKAFTAAWHEETRRTYAAFVETTRPVTAFGRPLITRQNGGDLNVAPALSPDGRRVVFLSELSMFAIEMYVADASTGKVTRKLVRTAGNPHFESLQFIESAGDWAPDNRRFVFAALAKGEPVLSIVDVDTGRREAEYAFADLDQIFNPAWSPDGHRIAFSAMKGGVLDLFVYDIDRRQTTQLTNDPHADYDPEWAPNGRELAWVTDRFSANPATLSFGNYRIGLIDVASKEARVLAGFGDGRNSNPEFSADGASLFFIATPDGIPNVYRFDLSTGKTTGATNVLSGVSGITPLTPALSVSAAADRLVFTVFEDNNYNLYAVDRASQLTSRDTPSTERNAAILPSFIRPAGEGEVARLLRTPTEGLPPPTEYEEKEYRPGLSIDGIAQPTVGVGADRFGTYAAGGLSLFWSDVLGNHELLTAVQLTNRFEEIGYGVGYFNRKHRLNWGIVGSQTPYVTGAFSQVLTNVNGQTVIAEDTLRVTQINREITGVMQYPFSRAHRLEVSGGVRRISFDQQIETNFFSPITGQQLGESKQELPRPDALNLAETSGALVYDSSLFGATSPILGQRYRLEYSQTAGSLLFSGVLADFRRYFMPVRPFTFAVRGLHYGRYGRDGEDGRLSPLFIGYPGLVRGYEIESFESTECIANAASDCPAFDRLNGSRLAVASAELRFPLVGVFSRRSFYGPLPIEVAVFGDAGVAWTSQSKPGFLGGNRDWARSVGAAVRFNVFGYVIGELDYVKPLDRPTRGWLWQFNLSPGF